MPVNDLDATPVRRLVEAAIESLIALLDVIDGDADLEPDWDDLGFDSDCEPEEPGTVPDYVGDDQRLLFNAYGISGPGALVAPPYDVHAGDYVRPATEDEPPPG